MDTQVADGMSLVEPLSATESTNVGAGEQRPSDAPKQLHDSEQSALSFSFFTIKQEGAIIARNLFCNSGVLGLMWKDRAK